MKYTAMSILGILFLLTACVTKTIALIQPGQGLPGTVVTITGRGFNPDPFANTVTIGGRSVRVISGSETELRVVVLRDIVTGRVVVDTGSGVITSASDFRRDGTTARATPLEDSDARLVEGKGMPTDKRFDMAAQGLNQKVLVVLAKPSDINPEDLAPAGKTARQDVIDKLANANTYFREASYNQLSADFTVLPDWVALSQIRDFYVWQADDVNRAQAAVTAAEAALTALELDPGASAAAIF